jgi:hypothetical protein
VGVLVNNDLAGGRAADVLAAYAYDWWLGSNDLEANYAKQLREFADIYARRKQQSIAEAVERAKRQSQLTQPLADYVGKYTNELLGTIDVVVDQNSLGVRLGYLYSRSTPYIEKDTIRVVMLPGGNGEVIGFEKGAAGKFDLLKYAGRDFKRAGL